MNQKAYDMLGNIAVVKFPKSSRQTEKKKFAEKLMKEQRNIKTVLEKSGKIKGRLRKLTTKYVAGEKTKEVLYHENGCVFRFNINKTYFSPRLSSERKELASKIKKNETVLVMFAGVAPLPIVVAKNSKAKKIVSVEINREASNYAKLNVELNKLKDKVEVIQADVKRLPQKIGSLQSRSQLIAPKYLINNSRKSVKLRLNKLVNITSKASANKRGEAERLTPKFDVIMMPRPQLKETFLKQAFQFSKKGTRIYYYDFCKQDETDKVVEKIKQEAKKYKKRIKILNVKKAGEIAPYKVRVRVDFIIL